MAESKSAHREDLSGFGGFTFANNSADRKGEHVGANHEIDENKPVFRVPKTGTNENLIPSGKTGDASYDDVFGGMFRSELLFWVASADVVAKGQEWCCYRLALTEDACGVILTNEVRYNQLGENPANTTVQIQTKKNGTYMLDTGAEVVFLTTGTPTFV